MSGTKGSMTGTDTSFTRGHAIAPPGELVAWLDAQRTDIGKPPRVRLPVWLAFDATGMGIAGASIGPAGDANAVALELNDAAMGISLADRAGQLCKGAPGCALWLEGVWRGQGRFDVLKVHRALADGEVATHAEIESPR